MNSDNNARLRYKLDYAYAINRTMNEAVLEEDQINRELRAELFRAQTHVAHLQGQLGRVQDALGAVERASCFTPGHGTLAQHVACLCEALCQSEQALDSWIAAAADTAQERNLARHERDNLRESLDQLSRQTTTPQV